MADDKPKQEEDFAALLAASERTDPRLARRARATVGERVTGKVVSIGSEVVFLDLDGGRGEGMLDLVEVRDAQGALTVAVGDVVEAVVVEAAQRGRALMLRRSLGRGSDARARAELVQAMEHGIPVEGVVAAANKGGVEVNVAGLRGFCPVSQLDLRPVPDAAAFVGQRLMFRIVQYEDDRRGPNVVLSRRALLEEEARARAAATRAKLAVGAVLPGVVTGLRDFGAFVDLGGIEGMLHVSELTFARVARPEDVLAVGQKVEVQVIRIEKRNDPKRPEQIALSLKSLERDPWDQAAGALREGARLDGTVTRVEPFGAFVELAPGVEGLVHISELGSGRPLRHARDAVQPGARLAVRVTAVDHERHRVSLALATGEEPIDDDARDAAARAAAPGKLGTLGDLLKDRGLTGKKR